LTGSFTNNIKNQHIFCRLYVLYTVFLKLSKLEKSKCKKIIRKRKYIYCAVLYLSKKICM